VVFGVLSLSRVGNREAYHATKAVLAGLRSRSACGASYRNGSDWTARIACVTALEKQNLEVTRPRHPLRQVAGFLVDDWPGRPFRSGTQGPPETLAQAAPTFLQRQTGPGTPRQLSPSGGVFPSAAQSATLTARLAERARSSNRAIVARGPPAALSKLHVDAGGRDGGVPFEIVLAAAASTRAHLNSA
jgi:hypothetical protein